MGSNIFNIAATLGLTALIIPLPVHGSAVRLEWPVMFAASLICLVVARGGVIDRVEGAVLLAALVLFIAYTVRVARRDVGAAEARQLADHVEARDIDRPGGHGGAPRALVTLAVLALGIGALVGGGRLLVDGAVVLARFAGLSERVIGLTIVPFTVQLVTAAGHHGESSDFLGWAVRSTRQRRSIGVGSISCTGSTMSGTSRRRVPHVEGYGTSRAVRGRTLPHSTAARHLEKRLGARTPCTPRRWSGWRTTAL